MTDADDDDDENMGTLLIALMQKERRKKRKEGLDMLTIGYAVYKVNLDNSFVYLEYFAVITFSRINIILNVCTLESYQLGIFSDAVVK